MNGVACGGGSSILKTTDGGKNWVLRLIDFTGMDLNSLSFIDALNGFCCGSNVIGQGIIMKTTNGGLSWSYLTHPGNDFSFQTIYFKDSLNGWVGGYDVYKTSDGGKTWVVKTSGQTEPIYQIYFCDDLHGWAMGSFGRYSRTVDGGDNWTNIILTEYESYSVYFKNPNQGWRVGPVGSIYYSADGGWSWSSQSITGPTLNFVTFNAGNGFAFGDGGVIVKTTNEGGITFSGNVKKNIDNNDFHLFQNYPNPFNPSTNISFHLPTSGVVTLKIFDILGREVSTLLSEYKTAGNYDITFDAGQLSSGVYFYRLSAGSFVETKKLMLIK